MTAPTKINFKVYQGSTFNETLRWESATKVYKTITAIFATTPLSITAVGHGMPLGWRGKISGVVGMTEVNSLDYIVATTVTTDNVTFNSVNTAGFKTYVSGGILEYNAPHDLAGVTARMQIREKISSTAILEELTTENNKIIINNTDKTITLNISATLTTAYTFKTGVYSLELINGSIVTPLIYGNITVESEITR